MSGTVAKQQASGTLTLVVNDKSLTGWQEVRVTRGCERVPSDFDIMLTERYPGQAAQLAVVPIIGSVSFVREARGGTTAELVLMPQEAFAVEPGVVQQYNAQIVQHLQGGSAASSAGSSGPIAPGDPRAGGAR